MPVEITSVDEHSGAAFRAPGHVTVADVASHQKLAFEDIATPAVLVDLDRVERNVKRFHAAIAGDGVALRPHAKTHKTPEIAALQLESGAIGLALAKASEAEVFCEAGCSDLVVAYPLIGSDKWQRVAALAKTAKVSVNVESEAGARGLSDAARAAGVTLGVQIEIDTGLGRCGFPLDDVAEIERLARALQRLPGLTLEGITTFRGRSFGGAAEMTNAEAGRSEAAIMVELADRLRENGLPIERVTVGSTATGPSAAKVDGITEVRAGAYVFYDGAHVSGGSATFDDVALTVLCTVVSAKRSGSATVDAGSKTFSSAQPPPGSDSSAFAASIDGLATLMQLSEEHGVAALRECAVEVGQRLRFVPYRASAVVGLANELVCVRAGRVEDIWSVRARGKQT